MDKFNKIKNIRKYYKKTKPFYKEFCQIDKLDENISNNILDIFPLYTDDKQIININTENTYSYHIIDKICDYEYIIDILDRLISQKINILPFIFDYNFNNNTKKWREKDHIHQLFGEQLTRIKKIDEYHYKYIIYYIIKHFEIEKWPQPQKFFEYIYDKNLFHFIKNIDNESLKTCINKVNTALKIIDIYERDINLDRYVLDIDEANKYIEEWHINY
jgi:hypothetical protein